MRQGLVVTGLLFAIAIPTVVLTGGWREINFHPHGFNLGFTRATVHVGAPSRTASGSTGQWLTKQGLAAAETVGSSAARLHPEVHSAGLNAFKPAPPKPPAVKDAQDFADALHEVKGSLKSANIAMTNMAISLDYGAAVKWYALARDPNNAEARFALGLDYLHKQPEPDYALAAHWLRSAADLGYARAQLALAGLLVEGKGVARDYPSAFMWYTLAEPGLDNEADRATAFTQRNRLASAMTSQELAEADRMIENWHPQTPVPLVDPDPEGPLADGGSHVATLASVDAD
jgi:hypothetical protein